MILAFHLGGPHLGSNQMWCSLCWTMELKAHRHFSTVTLFSAVKTQYSGVIIFMNVLSKLFSTSDIYHSFCFEFEPEKQNFIINLYIKLTIMKEHWAN